MALSYDDANTGVFTHIGKLIKHYDLFGTDLSNLAADRDEILDAFQLGDQDSAIDGLVNRYSTWENQYVQRRTQLARFITARLRDRVSVLEEIGATSDSLDEILPRLIDQMNTDSETVDTAGTKTVGTPAAAGGNTGNGFSAATGTLDGFNSPGSRHGVGFPALAAYNGLTSEFILAETITLECIGDSFQDGRAEGAETWEVRSNIENSSPHAVDTQASGEIGSITTHAQHSIVQNQDFENFTSNAPDSWDVDDGDAGTDILEETTAADVYHGSSALQYVGDGVQATHKISQTMTLSRLNANRMYYLSAHYKGEAGIAAGDLTIQFEGTGYTASGSEKISVNAAGLAAATSYTQAGFFIVMPASLPSDFELVIKLENTLTNTKNVRIDNIQFGPVDYLAGFGLLVGRGSTPWVRGDTITITNNLATAGTFQRIFTRVYGYQLPSSGTPTILDSLAE